MRLLTLTLLLFIGVAAQAQDSLARHPSALKQKVNLLYKFVKGFSQVDTNYIEPQRYNFTVMLQNTNTLERYTLRNAEGQKIAFEPQSAIKLGPYFGWRWIFLGYTIDVNHLTSDGRKEYDLSLYSLQLGVDLFWRHNGSNYKVKSFDLGKDVDTHAIHDADFSGLESSIKGFNLYYIFNHRKFSYPAAFSQSTIQRRSAGSAIAGIGYTHHTLNIDWTKFQTLVQERFPGQNLEAKVDSSMLFGRVKYTDVSVSGGYAYNWVFAHNWLFAASLQLALGYKNSHSMTEHRRFSMRDFDFKNFNLDGVGRFGLVYNNMRWYAGTSAVFHTYNYQKEKFSTNTLFGNWNIYVGFNFGKR